MNSHPQDAVADDRGSLLANAFRTTIVLWIFFYIAFIPAFHVPEGIQIAIAPIVLLFGGYRVGQLTGQGWAAGAKFGVVVTLINILLLGSRGSGSETGEVMVSALPWIGEFLVAAVILGITGAELGRRFRKPDAAPINWTVRLTLTVALAMFMLVIAGGIVTGMEEGMAVPDGLTTFNYVTIFFPLEQMRADAGVFVEHFHRLWGMLVGLGTIVLMVHLWRTEKRTWVKWFGVALFLAVLGQGLLGASRVIQNSLLQAMVHGVFGQCVLAACVCLAAVTSWSWIRSRDERTPGVRPYDFRLATVMFIALVVQLTLGAAFRHIQAHGEASTGAVQGAMHSHITGGVIVLVLAIIVGGKLSGRYRELRPMRATGTALMHSVGLQFVLGWVALIAILMIDRPEDGPIPMSEVAMTSLHQTFGAVVLVTGALLMVWSRRFMDPNAASSAVASNSG